MRSRISGRRRTTRRTPQRSPRGLWYRPWMDILEDRTLPSTLDFTGSDLIWNGFAVGTANNLSLTVVGTDYVLTDPAEVLNFGPGVPGSWSGNGTNTATGPIATVTSITIAGGLDTAASDTFALGSAISLTGFVSVTEFDVLNVNQSLTVPGGGSVTLSAAATPASTLNIAAAVTADGAVNLTGRGGIVAAAAITSSSQNVNLIGDDMAITGTISAAAANVFLQPFTTLRGIDLGTNSAGNLGLTAAELNLVTASLLRIGNPINTGNIQVTAPIVAPGGWNTLV